MTVGIIAFQGDVAEHIAAFEKMHVSVRLVKAPDDLDGITHLVIPGGESTVIGRFLQTTGLRDAIIRRYKRGDLAIWGTCAGAILLAEHGSPFSLRLLHATVARNAYGSQIDSFSVSVPMPANIARWPDKLNKPIEAVFIRAPKITAMAKTVQVLATYKKSPILCREGRMLISTFHPELTESTDIQTYFITNL